MAVRIGSRASAAAGVLAGAGVVVATAGRTWTQVTVPGLPGADVVTADGRLVAPGATALALVAAAGAVVLVTSGPVVRRLAAGLLVLAGLGVAALGVPVLADPADAVGPAVSRVTGTTGTPAPGSARATAWPWVSGAGGLLIVAGGAVGLARGRRWSGPARRFERGEPVARPRSAKDERLDAWDSLSAGDDPTD